MRWAPQQLRVRLVLGFGLTIIALAIAGLVGVRSLDRAHSDVQRNVGEVAAIGDRLFRIHDATLRLVTLAQGELMGGRGRAAEMDSLGEAADQLRRRLLTEPAFGTAERERIEQIGALQSRIGVRLAVAGAYRDIGRLDDAFRQATLATATLDTLFVELAALHEAQESRTIGTLRRIGAMVDERRFVLIMLLISGVGAAVLFGRTTWHGITGPLDRLLQVARTLGDGDLRITVPVQDFEEEFRVLAGAFDDTAARLREVLHRIQEESAALNEAAASLNTASEQAASSTGEISNVMSAIAHDADQQRGELSASTDSIARVGRAAGDLAETARQSQTAGATIRETARQTRTGLERALDSLNRAEQVITRSAGAVSHLEQASGTIEKLVDTIAGIADQTELLSLNAAIEAARAGEHGRGFAVVAEEVRKLATDSTRATEEVRAVVTSMRQEIESAVSAFRAGATGLGDVGAVSREAASALGSIDRAVPEVEAVSAALGTASSAVRDAVESLSQRLESIGLQAESQAAASEEAAAAAEESAAVAEQVAATARSLQQSAAHLRDLISSFKTS